MSDEPRNGNQRTSPVAYGLLIFFIFAILWIAVFYFPKARRDAQRTACLNNLKSIGIGINMYVQDYGNKLPLVRFSRCDDVNEYYMNKFPKPPKPPVKVSKFACFDDFSPNRYGFTGVGQYVHNTKVFTCPSTGDSATWPPVTKKDHTLGSDSYFFNCYCPGSKRWNAGLDVEMVNNVAAAPVAWDVVSGYGELPYDKSINVLYMDCHVQGSSSPIPASSTYWEANGKTGW